MNASSRLPLTQACFGDDLRDYVSHYAGLWGKTPVDAPATGVTFTPATQERNELEADQLVDWLENEFRSYPDSPEEQGAWRAHIFAALRRVGTQCFAFPDCHFDIIFSDDYFTVTRSFARQARSFDGTIETDALAQALRNVWVMNCLQMFLGRQPSMTPSVFAYSMLYPYTDNYLDQPRLSHTAKEGICNRLGLRLSGVPVEPFDAREATVFRLIAMIEAEFPRCDFPEVHESLRAIHAGQVKSLSQQCTRHPPDESTLLQISVEKGGSSVLADGWLVSGKLRRREADFFFGFGVMLQLLDDLQDLPEDRRAGHWTLFSRAAASPSLDRLTSRLWHFMNAVLDSEDSFSSPRGHELKDLIRRNSTMLMMRAVADNADSFATSYLRHIERYSPLRFTYLRSRRGTVSRRFKKVWPALARQRNLHSIFDLLG